MRAAWPRAIHEGLTGHSLRYSLHRGGRHGLPVRPIPEEGPLGTLLAAICHKPVRGALQLLLVGEWA